MKKGNEYNGVVERVEFGDRGIVVCQEPGGENDGKLAVVKNCIEGQKIVFRVRKKRSGKAEGDLVKVVEKSPLETAEPACPHFGLCGSCRYQELAYETQLDMKERQIKDILDAAVKSFDYEYEWQGIVPSPLSFEYRNKMEFSFGNAVKDGPLTLGLHKKGSFYDIMEVPECRIVDADFRAILTETLAVCRKYRLSFYHKMTHIGYLRHLLVRKAAHTGEILVDLVTSSQAPETEAEFLKEFTERIVSVLNQVVAVSEGETESKPMKGTIVSVLHTVNDSLSDTIQNDRTDVLYGRDYIEEILLGLHFNISAFSFFQTNSKGAECLYEKAREYVGETKDKVIFDLYSGTGTIAQLLAPVAKKVIGVEIVTEAVEAAKENAKKNSLDNCDFFAGDVLKMLDEITEKPDFIVLDPPRDGIHPKALKKIIDYGVDKLLYISCKPTSLARDLAVLQEEGYRVEKATAVDMFAQTYHVETVVLLSQQKPDDVIEVEIELDELDLTSAESKATYKEIQEYVLKEHGLKVSNLYISQVKRKCEIEVGENYNLRKATRRMDCSQADSTTAANLENDNAQGMPKLEGARGPVDLCSARTGAAAETARQPQCPEEKEKAIRDALEHFGMV